jgi:hypothetical protein
VAKPRLCQKCKTGEGHCAISSCVKAANAYRSGHAEALDKVRARLSSFELSALELRSLVSAGAITSPEHVHHVEALISIVELVEAEHA